MTLSKSDVAHIIQQTVPKTVITENTIEEDKDNRNYEISYNKIKALGLQATISKQEGVSEQRKNRKSECNV